MNTASTPPFLSEMMSLPAPSGWRRNATWGRADFSRMRRPPTGRRSGAFQPPHCRRAPAGVTPREGLACPACCRARWAVACDGPVKIAPAAGRRWSLPGRYRRWCGACIPRPPGRHPCRRVGEHRGRGDGNRTRAGREPWSTIATASSTAASPAGAGAADRSGRNDRRHAALVPLLQRRPRHWHAGDDFV
jgi:hypothetical protein